MGTINKIHDIQLFLFGYDHFVTIHCVALIRIDFCLYPAVGDNSDKSEHKTVLSLMMSVSTTGNFSKAFFMMVSRTNIIMLFKVIFLEMCIVLT